MTVAFVLRQDARVTTSSICALPLAFTTRVRMRAIALVTSVLTLLDAVALLDRVQTEAVEGPSSDDS